MIPKGCENLDFKLHRIHDWAWARMPFVLLEKFPRIAIDEELIAKTKTTTKQLDKRSWFFDLLNSVDGRPLFKLFLGYESPWWAEKRPSPVTGKVNTDLPLRQVYYYGQDQWNKQRLVELGFSANHNGHNNHSMLMASYSDSHYIEFWSELAKPQNWSYFGREGGTSTLSSQDKKVLDQFGAPLSMIIRAEHQLGLLHGKQVLRSPNSPRAEVGEASLA